MTRLETDSEEESDGDPNGVAGGGEEDSQGASGSSGEKWGVVERSGAGWRTDEHSPRHTTVQEHYRNKVANLNLRGT